MFPYLLSIDVYVLIRSLVNHLRHAIGIRSRPGGADLVANVRCRLQNHRFVYVILASVNTQMLLSCNDEPYARVGSYVTLSEVLMYFEDTVHQRGCDRICMHEMTTAAITALM